MICNDRFDDGRLAPLFPERQAVTVYSRGRLVKKRKEESSNVNGNEPCGCAAAGSKWLEESRSVTKAR